MLVFLSYYQPYIQNFSWIAKLLYNLLSTEKTPGSQGKETSASKSRGKCKMSDQLHSSQQITLTEQHQEGLSQLIYYTCHVRGCLVIPTLKSSLCCSATPLRKCLVQYCTRDNKARWLLSVMGREHYRSRSQLPSPSWKIRVFSNEGHLWKIQGVYVLCTLIHCLHSQSFNPVTVKLWSAPPGVISPFNLFSTVITNRASHGHRQYRQMGHRHPRGAPKTGGEKKNNNENLKKYIFFTSAITTISLKCYISPQQYNVIAKTIKRGLFSGLWLHCTIVLCEGGRLRGELPESDRTETPRPRQRFTDTAAELQDPKNWNYPAPSEEIEG